MDLVHDRGSMDPVQRGGPWTPGPCFVLTLKVAFSNFAIQETQAYLSPDSDEITV